MSPFPDDDDAVELLPLGLVDRHDLDARRVVDATKNLVLRESQVEDLACARVLPVTRPHCAEPTADSLPTVECDEVVQLLRCLEIDVGAQNHRSGDTEIAAFGQDILLGKVRGAPYVGVSGFAYNPKLRTLSAIMRMSIGMLQRAIRKSTGKYGRNVAILTHSGASAAKVSVALNAEPKPVRHKLSFDEAEAMLTASFAAFLLEPKRELDRLAEPSRAREWRRRRTNEQGREEESREWSKAIELEVRLSQHQHGWPPSASQRSRHSVLRHDR